MFRTLARCSAVQARCFSATPVKFEVFFTKSHEWVDFKGDGTATTGITQFAQEGLGEVVFIDLPEVGDNFEAGDEYGTVESVKTTSPLITPTSGTVQAVNAALTDDTSLVNESPEVEAWMIKLEKAEQSADNELMNREQYEEYLASDECNEH